MLIFRLAVAGARERSILCGIVKDLNLEPGTIVQCIGAVVDIQFPGNSMPRIYDALILEDVASARLVEEGLTFEVEQQLGDRVVRCIALGSSDGLQRGMKVRNTGAGISVLARPRPK